MDMRQYNYIPISNPLMMTEISDFGLLLMTAQGCGDVLYVDVKKRDPDTMVRIAGILQAPASTIPPAPVMQSPSPSQIPPRSLGLPGHTRPASSSTSTFSAMGTRNSFEYGSLSNTQSSFSSTSSSMREAKFLELCVNTGEHLKELGEIDLTNATCDGDLFGAVRERYLQIRGFRSKFWLLKPATVSFVRVRIY